MRPRQAREEILALNLLERFRRKVVHNPDYPKPPIREGERVLREGQCVLVAGMGGGRIGALLLTSQRVLWYETVSQWPLKRITGELELANVVQVKKASVWNFVLGAKGFRVKLKEGREKELVVVNGEVNDWIDDVRAAVSNAK